MLKKFRSLSFTTIELMVIAIAIGLVLALLEVKFSLPAGGVGAIGIGLAVGGVLDVVSVAPLQGWKQEAGAGALALCAHRFTAAEDGVSLEHWTDGSLRAIVPPEGLDSYLEYWPDAADVIAQLRISVPGTRAASGGTASSPTLADATAKALAALKPS